MLESLNLRFPVFLKISRNQQLASRWFQCICENVQDKKPPVLMYFRTILRNRKNLQLRFFLKSFRIKQPLLPVIGKRPTVLMKELIDL
jgi:hypothetical protein